MAGIFVRSLARVTDVIANRLVTVRVALHPKSKRYLHPTLVAYNPGVLKDGEDPLTLSNKDWEKRLSSDQYYVCREKGTELPFTGEHLHNYEKGIFSCTCCGAPLFSSETKYDSKSGWPSFYQALGSEDTEACNILCCHDNSRGMSRVEVVCKQCDAHLGHLFSDGPKPTGQRFCINSASIEFQGEGQDGSDS